MQGLYMSKKISFNTNLIYFIVLVVFIVIRICSSYNLFSFMGTYASYIMSFITQVGIIFLLPLVLFKTLNKCSFKQTFNFFSYKKVSFKSILVAILLGFVVFFLNVYVSNFFNSLIQLFGYNPSTSSSSSALPATWWTLILNLISTAVLPAICEETLHRGMLLKGNSQMGMKKSIIISGLLFGLLHLNIEQFFYASIIGLFLGYICWCCNSIYPCIIVHFMNNALSVFLSFASVKGWAIGSIFSRVSQFVLQSPVIGFILLFLVLILLFMLAIEFTKFLIKDSFEYNFGRRHKQLANMAIRESFFKQIEDIKNNTATENSLYSTNKKVVYIDFKDFLEFVNKKMSDSLKEEKNLFNQGSAIAKENKKKGKNISHIDLKIKILLWGSFVLSAIVTALTFVWGLFR